MESWQRALVLTSMCEDLLIRLTKDLQQCGACACVCERDRERERESERETYHGRWADPPAPPSRRVRVRVCVRERVCECVSV